MESKNVLATQALHEKEEPLGVCANSKSHWHELMSGDPGADEE